MHGRSMLVRGGAAAASAAAALMIAAPVALADDNAPAARSGAASGELVSGGTSGFDVNIAGKGKVQTTLFNFKLSDGALSKMYCVQIEVGARFGEPMLEHAWNDYPDAKSPFRKNNKNINWVLHHSFPAEDVATLEKTLSDKGVKLHDGLSTEEALTATQAAVWHYSDGKDLDAKNPLANGSEDEAADVLALYDYLTGDANTGVEETKPALSITPAKASGEAGTKIGPFTVATTGSITDFTSKLPEGVKLVGENGEEIKSSAIKNGTKLFLDVPKDAKPGTAELAVKAAGDVNTGRLFVAKNYADKPAQSLIVAQSQKSSVQAAATGTWTETGPVTTAPATTAPAAGGNNSGQTPLANTGVNAALPIGIGAALVIAGGAMMLVVRRRRSNA
ncbi:TQXA domain-containing protein [Amycolatopsis sp. AA4]|uniref:thioester domain-containing protein n=1 Tax=Actinomycetes TaxID=1760 RepID=UPI00056851D2|nr:MULTISPECIES: thioester domain-containing protein [Actinomycetes]ATY14753.1 TQXA domain-containing protein [Amycolatopsis sp. AA4]